MLSVSDETRQFYIEERSQKFLDVYIHNSDGTTMTIPPSKILAESMELTESISETETVEFVGCISSQFKLQIIDVKDELKGKRIEVFISANDETIPLFKGKIDSEERTSNRKVKEIIAYDKLYELQTLDMKDYLNHLEFPMTLREFRYAFFDEINIEQENANLECDSLEIPNYDETADSWVSVNSETNAIDVIKSICHICGVFGIINRYGKFEYRKLGTYERRGGAIPGYNLTLPFIPGYGGGEFIDNAQYYPSYRSLTCENFTVRNYHKVDVKQDDSSSKVGYYGNDGFKYLAMGNLFTRFCDIDTLNDIARRLYMSIKDYAYVPFNSVNIGLPFIEVGDACEFYIYDFEESEATGKDVYKLKTFFILNRTLKGIMSLTDYFNANGDLLDVTISDLGLGEDAKESANKNREAIEHIRDDMFDVQSVSVLPEDADDHPKTIYLIQGTVG